MKKSVELPAGPAHEKKPLGPPAQESGMGNGKPSHESGEREQKKNRPADIRAKATKSNGYYEPVHPGKVIRPYTPGEAPW